MCTLGDAASVCRICAPIICVLRSDRLDDTVIFLSGVIVVAFRTVRPYMELFFCFLFHFSAETLVKCEHCNLHILLARLYILYVSIYNLFRDGAVGWLLVALEEETCTVCKHAEAQKKHYSTGAQTTTTTTIMRSCSTRIHVHMCLLYQVRQLKLPNDSHLRWFGGKFPSGFATNTCGDVDGLH